MKKTRLLNSELSYEIAKMGHTSHITICDAGLPIPKDLKRIDLAVEQNIPKFIEVLNVVSSEMEIEEIILATEIKNKNEKVYMEILDCFKQKDKEIKINWVSHERLKEITKESVAIVRTGECTPYANIILKSGVVF